MRNSSLPQKRFALAEKYRAQGLFAKALPSYQEALKGNLEPSLRFESYLGLASICRSLGEIRQAVSWIKAARNEQKRSRLKEGAEALELEDILVERAAGQYERSLKRLQSFFKRRFAEKDWQACGFVKWAMGGALRFSGNLKDSQKAYQDSLHFAQKAGDGDGKIYALLGLGGVCRIQGKIAESARHYRLAGRSLLKSEDLFAKAYAFCGLGNALRQMGELDEAKGLYQKSRILYQKLGDAADLGYVEWGLAQIDMNKGRLDQAEKNLMRAMPLFKKADEKRGLVLTQMSLARVWHARGKTASARSLFDQAVRLSKSSGLSAHLESFT